MSIRVALRHRTSYHYDRPVSLSPQIIRLRPAPHSRTKILAYALKIGEGPHFLNWQQDPQSNWLARVVFPEKVRAFTIDVDVVAQMETVNPFDFFLEPQAETWPFEYDPMLAEELAPFRRCEEPGPRLQEWLAGIPRKKTQTTNFLVDPESEAPTAHQVLSAHGTRRTNLRGNTFSGVRLVSRLGMAAGANSS